MNRTETIYCLLAVLMLAGCSDIVYGWQVEQITKQCANKGGLDHITTIGLVKGVCRDGAVISPRQQ